MTAKLIWATPEGDKLVGFLARVSNSKAQLGDPTEKLIKYLLDHKHFSPFEMVNACVEIDLPRDISHQILRHRSFSFQEFSGRYAEYEALYADRELRLLDQKNRQNSFSTTDIILQKKWRSLVRTVRGVCWASYITALRLGVAKEVARILLPEGLVPSRVYMNGTLRSWIHYWDVRCTPATQKEHRLVAEATREVILAQFPEIAKAIGYDQDSIS